MSFCIPKKTAEKLKESISTGSFDVKKIYEMTAKERIEFFGNFSDQERVVKKLSSSFESAIKSKQKGAIQDWITSTFKSNTKEFKQAMQAKDNANYPINTKLYQVEQITENSLGVGITKEDYDFSRKISKELKSLNEKIAGPNNRIENVIGEILVGNDKEKINNLTEYFAKHNEIESYIAKRIGGPSTKDIIVQTIGPGALLASTKSFISNIAFNIVPGLGKALTKRFTEASLNIFQKKKSGFIGENFDLISKYTKEATQIRYKTGVDVTRLQGLGVSDVLEKQVLSEKTSKIVTEKGFLKSITTLDPKEAIKNYGKVFQDIVFDKSLGTPDTFFSSLQFADSASLYSTTFRKQFNKSKEEGRKAMIKMFNPVSDDPLIMAMREQSLADAMYAVYQNETALQRATQGLKKWLNDNTRGIVGTGIMPFTNVPSNAISQSLEWSGLGVINGLVKMTKAWKGSYPLKESQKLIREGAESLIRGGLGITGAYIFADNIPVENFMGAYDPERRSIDELQNVSYNAVNIKGKWISIDYFGPLAPMITVAMYQKKYGYSIADVTSFDTYKLHALNATAQLQNAPLTEGLQEITDLYKDIKNIVSTDNSSKTKEGIKAIERSLAKYLTSRTIPALAGDISKLTKDKKNDIRRTIDIRTEGDEEDLLNYGFQAVIAEFQDRLSFLPWSKEMSEKVTLFGDNVPEDSALYAMTTGARMRDAVQTDVIKEIVRLTNEGEQPNGLIKSFLRRDKTTKKLEVLATQEELLRFDIDYGKKAYEEIYRLMQKNIYINAENKERAELISDVYSQTYRAEAQKLINKLKREGRKPSVKETIKQEEESIAGTPVINN